MLSARAIRRAFSKPGIDIKIEAPLKHFCSPTNQFSCFYPRFQNASVSSVRAQVSRLSQKLFNDICNILSPQVAIANVNTTLCWLDPFSLSEINNSCHLHILTSSSMQGA